RFHSAWDALRGNRYKQATARGSRRWGANLARNPKTTPSAWQGTPSIHDVLIEWDDKGHDDVGNDQRKESRWDAKQGEEESNQGGVHAQVLAEAAADAGQHAVRAGAHQAARGRQVGPAVVSGFIERRRRRWLAGRSGQPSVAVLALDGVFLDFLGTIGAPFGRHAESSLR